MNVDYETKPPQNAIEWLRQQRVDIIMASYRRGLIGRAIARGQLKDEWLFDDEIDQMLEQE